MEGRERSVTTSAEFLVVEDHPMVMRTLKTYLQRVGTVVEAGTVQEGLRAFEEHPNLAGMLVDVNLPDGLGTDLIREIRRRDPVLPILMLTGSDERGWANEAHALGVEFVFKPIVTESLERFSARAVARASSGDDSLAAVVSAYWLVTFACMLVFGHERWSRRGEFLGVFFGMLAKFAILGCEAAKVDGKRRLVLRWPGAGLAEVGAELILSALGQRIL